MNKNEIVKKLSDLLVGEAAFGDDGEPAIITGIYRSPRSEDRIFVDIRQDDGIRYQGFDLFNFLDAIDTDDDTINETKNLLDLFYEQ